MPRAPPARRSFARGALLIAAAEFNVVWTARPMQGKNCLHSSFCLASRWNDTIAGLVGLQVEYNDWLEALPDNQQDSATAEALRAIVELDLSDLQAIEPPRGFGRD